MTYEIYLLASPDDLSRSINICHHTIINIKSNQKLTSGNNHGTLPNIPIMFGIQQ